MKAKIARLLHTIRYLKSTQLAFFVLRRKFPVRSINYDDIPELNHQLMIDLPNPINEEQKDDYEFKFLNITKDYNSNNINWSPNDVPRLWRYNFHYFDYLRDGNRSVQSRLIMIESWIDSNPQGSQPGWEPFTASLRIVNWIFFLANNREACSNKIHHSLYLQCLWLEKNDEKHILANHYFENLKALLFAGCFFNGENANRWLARTKRELLEQIEEQTLSDGGHYERSPQYHSLMLENYLDIYNLAVSNSNYFEGSFTSKIKEKIQSGLIFLGDIVFPDQQIPLFNDSAFGISPTFKELEIYASRLIDWNPTLLSSSIIHKVESGFYGYRNNQDMLIMDCGDIGPDYQPGHTHCDFLSYELMKDGQRIIVDTGTSEYEPGERRHYLRSTAAHNTVSINQMEQSVIWGEFRVAQRAKKKSASIDYSSNEVLIKAAYRGFFKQSWSFNPEFEHSRQINVKLVKESIKVIEVVDRISALSKCQEGTFIQSFIHFHPDIDIEKNNDGKCLLQRSGKKIGELSFMPELDVLLEKAIYCPEFGKAIPNYKVTLQQTVKLPFVLQYTINLH